jgi:hypothetical protein
VKVASIEVCRVWCAIACCDRLQQLLMALQHCSRATSIIAGLPAATCGGCAGAAQATSSSTRQQHRSSGGEHGDVSNIVA